MSVRSEFERKKGSLDLGHSASGPKPDDGRMTDFLDFSEGPVTIGSPFVCKEGKEWVNFLTGLACG